MYFTDNLTLVVYKPHRLFSGAVRVVKDSVAYTPENAVAFCGVYTTGTNCGDFCRGQQLLHAGGSCSATTGLITEDTV